jgi:hypothetical protein
MILCGCLLAMVVTIFELTPTIDTLKKVLLQEWSSADKKDMSDSVLVVI